MQNQVHVPRQSCEISRRELLRSAAIGAGYCLVGTHAFAESPARPQLPPLAVFSKVYQPLKLDFNESAEVTAEAGLDGIDCAVRAGGEILPERAADDMPRYAEALAKHGGKMLLLTTDITGVDTPHARDILNAGRKLDIHFYRLGFYQQQPDASTDKQTSQ